MKTLAFNRRVKFDYEILETVEAGLVLSGQEVKSAKSGAVSLKGSFVSIQNNEAFVVNCHISPYKQASNVKNYSPSRERKLLLKTNEIERIKQAIKSEGKTIIPLKMKEVRGLIKLEIAVCKSKKKFDKRQTIKKRDMLRDASRELK